MRKAQKGLRQSTKRQNRARLESKCYNYSNKGYYAYDYKKPKKDNCQTAATTSKAKKSPKEKKAETRTSKTKEIYLLIKSIKGDSNLDNRLEVLEES